MYRNYPHTLCLSIRPQNIFAIERMSMEGKPPSWLSWFAVALPVAIISECLPVMCY